MRSAKVRSWGFPRRAEGPDRRLLRLGRKASSTSRDRAIEEFFDCELFLLLIEEMSSD